MGLPIAGGGPRRPSMPATHTPLPFDKLMKLLMVLEDAAEDGFVSGDIIEDVAADNGVAEAHVYAAGAFSMDVQFKVEEEVRFIVCAGGCQGWGAVERLEELVRARQARADDGQRVFDIETRKCLDRCDGAAVVMVQTPDGTAVITGADTARLADAIAAI